MSDNNPDNFPEGARRTDSDEPHGADSTASDRSTEEPRIYSFPDENSDDTTPVAAAPAEDADPAYDAAPAHDADPTYGADSTPEDVTVTAGARGYETRLGEPRSELAADADEVVAEALAADIEAVDAGHDLSGRSKYVPPALVDPDAAARAVSAAAAARAAERAAERANAAAKLAGLSSGSAAVDEAIGYTPPARLTSAPVSEQHAPTVRSADLVQFTAPNKVIDRSNYVITPDSELDTSASAALVPARATAAEPVQATPDPADAVFTRPEQRIVYVEAPAPPQKKGNRGIGSLLAVVSALAFGVLFAAVITLVFWVTTGRPVTNFIGVASFYVPVAAYAVGFVLLVLVLNRAKWWAYILGSIFVGLFVYFGTAGVLLLLGGAIQSTPAEASADFARVLADPLVIAAGILGREVSMWTGAAIASRGRRVREKNAKALEVYNQELDDRKAGNGRAAAGTAD